ARQCGRRDTGNPARVCAGRHYRSCDFMTSSTLARVSRRSSALLIIAALAVIFIQSGAVDPLLRAQSTPIVAENALTGNPASEWDVSGAGDPTIQGFATDISVNVGQ